MKFIWTKKLVYILIIFYLIVFGIGWVLFKDNFIDFNWSFLQLLVIVFFAFGGILFFYQTKAFSEKKFIRYIFIWSLLIKVIIVFFNYYIFDAVNGFPFIMHSDSFAYNEWGQQAAHGFSKGIFNAFKIFPNSDLSDMGGKFYYGIIYFLFGSFGNKIIIARIFNALFASLTVIYFYKTLRFVSESDVARTSAILFLFFPLFNLYAGTHYKESIFLFFIMLAAFESYKIFFVRHYSFIDLTGLFFAITASFFFRTVMGPVLFFSLLGFVLFNIKQKFSFSFGVSFIIIFVVLLFVYQNLFRSETEQFAESGTTYSEKVVAQAKRNTGNKFSFGQLINAPFMFVATLPAPLPTIVVTNKHEDNRDFGLNTYLSSAFIKIFLSFWVLFGIYFTLRKRFKQNSYILLFFFAYYTIIVISGNGFIIRYVMPMLPFFIYFAVIGIKNFKRYLSVFMLFLLVIIFVIIYYNYMKLNAFGIIVT